MGCTSFTGPIFILIEIFMPHYSNGQLVGAGSRAAAAEVSAQELVALFGLHAVKNLAVFNTKNQITTMES